MTEKNKDGILRVFGGITYFLDRDNQRGWSISYTDGTPKKCVKERHNRGAILTNAEATKLREIMSGGTDEEFRAILGTINFRGGR